MRCCFANVWFSAPIAIDKLPRELLNDDDDDDDGSDDDSEKRANREKREEADFQELLKQWNVSQVIMFCILWHKKTE